MNSRLCRIACFEWLGNIAHSVLAICFFSDSVVKSKANLLEAEIKIQTDVLKKLKDSNGSKSSIRNAANLLFRVRRK